MPFNRRALLTIPAALACMAADARAEDIRLLPTVLGTTELREFDGLTGLGLGGTDPVSYFVGEVPRAGLVSIETIWGGIAWRFGSQANRAAFLRDPEAFLPRIGGYDALAAASGRVVGASPLVFVRQASRLYLFRSEETRRRFLADAAMAGAAEARWSEIRAQLVVR